MVRRKICQWYTFTILPTDKVSAILNHLNSINPKIQFTMELEADNKLAFLDILLIRNPDQSLSHTVYSKVTHTDGYLNGDSHRTTVERPPTVLPYIKGVTNKIERILKRAFIYTYFKSSKKMNQLLRPVKCNIPFQSAGVYKLEFDCGLLYIGQTNRGIGTRVK
ncbi:unnamed protein product [Diatraea saccharalis]|uniref:Uncharacterized protein n=1 Tax=Diatraea saccharalis TaxID=40085 RepID=A0A9N9QYJ9_9NEOP|nr:unnamed protein product [Diatraea saccharalis]